LNHISEVDLDNYDKFNLTFDTNSMETEEIVDFIAKYCFLTHKIRTNTFEPSKSNVQSSSLLEFDHVDMD